jgi:CheY-like chemotaxis protein
MPEVQQHPVKTGIIPTIVITAHDGLGTRERCRSAGAVDYLLKPLQEAPLISAIDAADGGTSQA